MAKFAPRISYFKTFHEHKSHFFFKIKEKKGSKMLKRLLKKQNPVYFYQTFTYFIPAPKQKASSYQESQFDNLLAQFLFENQLQLISISSQSIVSEQTEGLWVIATCKGITPPKTTYTKEPKEHSPIEGLYHINETNSQ